MCNEVLKKPTHKPHFCIFCKTSIKRIHEHFLRKHGKEEKILTILSITEKKQGYWAWKKLTQEGDYFFNTRVADTMEDKKIVMVPRVKTSRKKYFDCRNCLGRIRTCSRQQHYKVCQSMLKDTVLQTQDAEEVSSSATQEEVFKNVPEGLINQIRRSVSLTKFLLHLFEERKNTTTVRTAITDLTALEDSIQKATGERKKPLVTFFNSPYVDFFINIIKSLSKEKKQKIIQYPHKAQRILTALNKGTLKYYKGKRVDDITFGDGTNNKASTSECLSTHKEDGNSTETNVVIFLGNPKASVSGFPTRSMKTKGKKQ